MTVPLALVVKDELKAQVLSPNFPDLTDRLIKSAHNRGLTVIPWTVNEKSDIRARSASTGSSPTTPDTLLLVAKRNGLR